MDAVSRKILDSMKYAEERSGNFTLFYLNKYTGIQVARSHEGYSHFQQYYVKKDGKVKYSFAIKEREAALHAGMSLFLEKVSDAALKAKGK